MKAGKRRWIIFSTALITVFFTGMNLLKGEQSPDTGKPGGDTSTYSLRQIAENKMHHGKDSFVNPFNPDMHGRMWEVLKWKVFAENTFKDFYADEKIVPVTIDWQEVREHSSVSVTFITHSTVLIKDGDSYILVDPVLFGLFWPIRDFTPLDFDIASMPRPDIILITHGHYDHLDKRSLSLYGDHSTFISPLGYSKILDSVGAKTVRELDWYGSYTDGSREIILLPCNHWTMRNPLTGPNTELWGSYLIKTSTGQTIYISGDTAYFD
ncbi:MAG: MBL fold metallo-hydrolase, partial [Desulfomonilia bacterium]